MNETLDINDVIANITEAMQSLDGEEIAELHNHVCSAKIEYDEDSMWNYIGEEE